SSSVKNVCATGPGSAMPVVSMMTRSNFSAPVSRFSLSVPRIRIKSPRTVQQTQPLFISTICSSDFSMIALSTPTSPNSFSITAMRWPWSSLRIRFSSVVLPAPRKPVRIVTGTMLSCCMRETPNRRSAILPLRDQQPLQVLTFGKIQCHGMVGRGAEALDDLRIGGGIDRGTGDDRLEKLCGHAARARERREQAARFQQLQREQVDVLVGACGVLRQGRGRRELRRVEDDEIERAAAIAQLPQMREHIGLRELEPRGIERVCREILA